jgi:hypothetical protein
MEVCVDIDAELLGQFDQAARAHNITRNTAVRALALEVKSREPIGSQIIPKVTFGGS